MEPEELAERVWPGQQATIEPLRGGITNRNFTVDVGGEKFVLRIAGKDSELLGIDRPAEYAASRAAAALGLGLGRPVLRLRQLRVNHELDAEGERALL